MTPKALYFINLENINIIWKNENTQYVRKDRSKGLFKKYWGKIYSQSVRGREFQRQEEDSSNPDIKQTLIQCILEPK